jgi:5-methylcytosine-specific restriction endonuclease McrA
MMGKASYIQRFGKKLAKRGDDWVCHYCEKPLVPLNAYEHDKRYYYLDGIETLHDGMVKEHWRTKPEFGYPSIDHIVTRVEGGTDDLDNLVLACWGCNTERNKTPYADFMAMIKARPKGYPHCVRCGQWYAEWQARDGQICRECAERQSRS